ncbi:MAG: hypothetical protein ACRD10_08305, partial [Terriglobia bacterium]
EVEDYAACWIEITVDEPSDMDAKQAVLLGTDFQYRLNGRQLTLRKRQDWRVRSQTHGLTLSGLGPFACSLRKGATMKIGE